MEPTTTALVIGSGMYALATAEVLSRHFERVAVTERDEPLALQQQHDALYAARLAKSARPGVQQVGRIHLEPSCGTLSPLCMWADTILPCRSAASDCGRPLFFPAVLLAHCSITSCTR